MRRETTTRMADDPATTPAERRRASEETSTAVNALVGAAVTVLAAPLLPLSAVAGGGVAGYLQRGDPAAGARVGVLSGLIASIPAFLLFWFVLGLLTLGPDPVFALASVVAVVAFVAVVGYLVVAGAVGGALGAYVRDEL